MEPNSYQYTDRHSPLQRGYRLALAAIVIISVVLIALTIAGYGHLSIDAPAGSVVTVNGHTVNPQDLRLRPGTYQVGVQSAAYYASYQDVRISAFRTNHYKPDLKHRSATSVVNASAASLQRAGVSEAVWLGGNTWLVAIAGQGGSIVVASHYEAGRWELKYGTAALQDTSKLPPEVQKAVAKLIGELSART